MHREASMKKALLIATAICMATTAGAEAKTPKPRHHANTSIVHLCQTEGAIMDITVDHGKLTFTNGHICHSDEMPTVTIDKDRCSILSGSVYGLTMLMC